ncbi:YcjF family protein [Deinococcus multiflagellatus]|uniref:YcjF family protein n=1 Tax=Deinococcus multiflagellatus TaxID=1656887 RepID=A0ABW1ZJA7_9DEIO|nr:YcjF family protein [Deinococcus multiflagellatus]MBZ9714278.1 YcjF family protein [Deinococcus multiflagellatus]
MLPPLVKQVLDNFNLDVDPTLSREENAEEVIKSAALLSGAIAVEPIPFADMFLITPVQGKMVLHIGKIYGFDITPERSLEIAREIGVTIAYGMAARQVMRGLAKLALPVIGGLITAPAVYGWTFALGRLAQNYFERRALGLPDSRRDQVKVVQEAKRDSRRVLPGAQDFSDLASELRRRAEQKNSGGPSRH